MHDMTTERYKYIYIQICEHAFNVFFNEIGLSSNRFGIEQESILKSLIIVVLIEN